MKCNANSHNGGSIISSTNAMPLNGLGSDAPRVPGTLGRSWPFALAGDPAPSGAPASLHTLYAFI